jgi:large subunit ribosomal protein L6
MSRIGKRPVPVPANVQAAVEGQLVKIKGPKGELSLELPEEIKVSKGADGICVEPRDETKKARSMWGMSRTLIDNQIKGVVDGYAKTLEIHGVGFRAQLKGKDLTLQLGFSHEINYKVPASARIRF